ncbi:MAG TPA: hypothetical protein VHU40_03855 [Polyangia bacterium]|nr:hypothetical protein [Polyangia bacterium]
MSDLGPEAREFIEAHRSAGRLTSADRARIKQKLMLRVSTVGATTAVAGTAAGMSLGSKIVLMTVTAIGLAGAGTFSVWAVRQRARAPVMPTAIAVPTAANIAPAEPMPEAEAPSQAAPVVSRVVVPSSLPQARSQAAPVRARASRPPVTVTATSGTARAPLPQAGLGDPPSEARPKASPPESPPPATTQVEAADPQVELRAVREARDELRAGRPASAYRRLNDFDRRSPGGMLTQERSALAAIALCQSRPGPDAQARAAEFLRRAPDSPLAPRVRSACKASR